jgi:hypothetical protein
MNRRATLALVTLAAVGIAGSVPALAAKPKPKPKPISGTWSYTDYSIDPTPSVTSAAGNHPYCHDPLPASPADVNVHTIKVKGRGVLSVAGQTTGDWGMEVDDAKGTVLGTSDGTQPQDQEGTIVDLTKAGTYSVLYCNFGGAPTATAKYRFVYR